MTMKVDMIKDRKQSLWNRWEKHIEDWNSKEPGMAGPSFHSFCRLLLCNADFFNLMDDGSFVRKDVLDILIAHATGHIDCHTPYPWDWKDDCDCSDIEWCDGPHRLCRNCGKVTR